MIAARPRSTNPAKVNAVSEDFQVSAHAKRRNREDGAEQCISGWHQNFLKRIGPTARCHRKHPMRAQKLGAPSHTRAGVFNRNAWRMMKWKEGIVGGVVLT